MKKKTLFISALAISLLLCSCGSKSLPSEKAIDCAEKAIDCSNEFIAGDLSYDEFKSTLDELTGEMSYVEETGDEENNPNHSEDLYVQIDISSIKTSATAYNLKKEDRYIDEIKDDVDHLEELIHK